MLKKKITLELPILCYLFTYTHFFTDIFPSCEWRNSLFILTRISFLIWLSARLNKHGFQNERVSSYSIDIKWLKEYVKLQLLVQHFLVAQMSQTHKIASQKSHPAEAHHGWLTLTGWEWTDKLCAGNWGRFATSVTHSIPSRLHRSADKGGKRETACQLQCLQALER